MAAPGYFERYLERHWTKNLSADFSFVPQGLQHSTAQHVDPTRNRTVLVGGTHGMAQLKKFKQFLRSNRRFTTAEETVSGQHGSSRAIQLVHLAMAYRIRS